MLDKFLYQVNQFPDRIAIKANGHSLTYGELMKQASVVSSGIQNQGIKEMCIGISLKSKTDELITCIGILLSNNHFFFIPEGIEDAWWEQVPVSLLITDRDQLKKTAIPAFDFNTIKKTVVSELDPWWEHEDIAKKLFCIYCTSGSTSSSKYVVHDYQSIAEDTNRQVDENKISESDTLDFIFASSFSSSLANIFPALISGASIAIFDLSPKNLKDIPQFWLEQQVTFATLTSSSFRTLARISTLNLASFTKSIRFLCLGGEPILKSDLQLFVSYFPENSEIQLAYASTETRTLSQLRINQNTPLELIHDGFPVRNKTIKILDQNGKDCPAEKEGELVIYSPYISLGYYNNGTLHPHKQEGENRVYRTGDCGVFSTDGSIRLTGRTHSMQKVNGKWVSFNELENMICLVSHSLNCKILRNKDENGFDYLIACLEVKDLGSDNSPSNSINTQIKSEVLPRFYLEFKDFPLNANGKIDKNKMLEIAQDKEFSNISDQIKDPITQQIHQIWCQQLGVSISNLDADFFTDLGGSSLLSLFVVDELARKFDQDLESHLLFQYRTISKLAQFLNNTNEEKPLPLIDWINSEQKAHLPYLFFIEIGHFSSFKNLLASQISSDNYNLAYLRIDLFKVLQGHHSEEIMEEILAVLKPFSSPVLLATSFNGFIAAKINQKLGGALILIDSPWYRKDAFVKIPIQNRLLPIYHRFRSLPFRQAIQQVGSLILGYGIKKATPKKGLISPFERSVSLFVSQSVHPTKISNLLYFYSTGSAMTSKKDVENWKKIADSSFSAVDILGDHLDALSEANSDLVARKINEFLAGIVL
ncbi:non-ribosomal peptide synthetase [Algoriphagus aquimarinus]|uniref:non-ribosomal peptide synthetase n=1 Tax=Algoriphagus aquimarinus TaxID=237018 RepID=UPI0030D98E57|tara:strand:+ start:167174 stop:169630 length:2457 start_codon:yes stop_codon:yes gene_type:complete